MTAVNDLDWIEGVESLTKPRQSLARTFMTEYGLILIDEWVRSDRPLFMCYESFTALVDTCLRRPRGQLHEESQEKFADYTESEHERAVSPSRSAESESIPSRQGTERLAGTHLVDSLWKICMRPTKEAPHYRTCPMAELMPLIGLTCILLPIRDAHQAAQIVKAFAFESNSLEHQMRSGNSQEEAVMKNLTVEEFDLFTQQAMTGLSRLLDHDITREDIQKVITLINNSSPSKELHQRTLGIGTILRRLGSLKGICRMLMALAAVTPGALYGRNADQSALKKDDLFAGRYRILETLSSDLDGEAVGTSEIGFCFRAVDELRHVIEGNGDAIAEDLALHVFPYLNGGSDDLRGSLQREAVLLKELSPRLNGSLIKVFDFGESAASYVYEVREIIDGISLAEYLSRKRAVLETEHSVPFQPRSTH